MTRHLRKQPRGFTLVELLIASTILIIGLTGLTSLVIYSSKTRGTASKKAFAARYAADQLSQLSSRGYDGLIGSVGAIAATPVDWLGRSYVMSGTVSNDCNAATIKNDHGGSDPSTFAVPGGALGAAQTCCPGTGASPNLCCIYVEVDVNYTIEGADGGTVTASTFVTKGCP